MKNDFLKSVLQYLKFFVILIVIGIIAGRITYKIQDNKSKKQYEDSIYYERIRNAPLRDYKPTQDSLWREAEIKRLEQSTKELLK